MKIKSFILKVVLIPLFIFGHILLKIKNTIKEKVLRTKIRSLLKSLPSNCYLEINYLAEKVTLKPIVDSHHNNLIAMENKEKFIKKYNNFYKMFIRNDLYYISYDSIIRAYREDKKIIINYHRYHQEEVTVQEIY